MNTPLADRLRPKKIEDVSGQKHLLSDGKVLRRIIDSGEMPNLIFYGPSGVGKTTVANIIANNCGKKLYHLNATTASTADIKEIINSIGSLDSQGGILLYLDEIQFISRKILLKCIRASSGFSCFPANRFFFYAFPTESHMLHSSAGMFFFGQYYPTCTRIRPICLSAIYKFAYEN